MIRFPVLVACLALLPALVCGDDEVYHVGKQVSSPRLLHKVDPDYSAEGKRNYIQGTALYSIVVDKSGVARDIEVLSPIGYGLDERGTAAIQKWTFAPAMKDGLPVSVYAQIEVNFRFQGMMFDSRTEANRTAYNAALHSLQNPERKQKAVEKIEGLAGKKYPPAMTLVGVWKLDGSEETRDIAGGVELVKKAADQSDGNGLFLLSTLYAKGVGVPTDPEKSLKLMRDASVHGNPPAQLEPGTRYEAGNGVNADSGRARYYYRLCAARGTAQCQHRLGRLLEPVVGSKGDGVQALAWLELAAVSMKEAESEADVLRQTLSAEEVSRAEKLRPQLLRH